MDSSRPIAITPTADGKDLSKAQKTFNTQIKKIERLRAELRAWELIQPQAQQKYVEELLPQIEKLRQLQATFVRTLDSAHGLKGLTKTERRMISEILGNIAGDVAELHGDTDLKDIYNRHSGSDLDEEIEADARMMKQALEESLGVDLGEDLHDISLEEAMERASDRVQQHAQEAAGEAQQERKTARKKTAKQQAAEERKRADEAQLNQSIRDIYRKLARMLHPDRETDPAERERKTSLMTRVNQAYEKNDLLTLLELQLELEHIDQASIDGISDARLSHFNRILREQASELDRELFIVKGRFREQFNLPSYGSVTPKTALAALAGELGDMRRAQREMQGDIDACRDVKQLKSRLKVWHAATSIPDFDTLLDSISF